MLWFCRTVILFVMLISLTEREVFAKGNKVEDVAKSSKPSKPKKYKYNLAICAIFRDEAPYLQEWIEFHRLLGVEHFYLYNNLSSDNYKIVLAPYIKKKIVEVEDWSYTYQDVGRWSPIQCSAYGTKIPEIKDKVKWLAILDIDEFLFPTQGNNLQDFLKDYEDFGGVCVNWQMYGTSNIAKIPAGKLLIETLLLKAPKDYCENALVKSIVRPERVRSCESPHYCFFLPPYFQVNEHKEPFDGPNSPYITVDKIRVNHYWSRDENFFNNVKIARRQSWQESTEGIINRKNNLSVEEDDAILRFVPQLRKTIFKK